MDPSDPHLDELGVGPRREDRVRLELRADALQVQLINLQALVWITKESHQRAQVYAGVASFQRPVQCSDMRHPRCLPATAALAQA